MPSLHFVLYGTIGDQESVVDSEFDKVSSFTGGYLLLYSEDL